MDEVVQAKMQETNLSNSEEASQNNLPPQKYSTGSTLSKYYFNREFSEVKFNKPAFRRVSIDFLQMRNQLNTKSTKDETQIDKTDFINEDDEIRFNATINTSTRDIGSDNDVAFNSGNKSSDSTLFKSFDDLIEKLNCLQNELNNTIENETPLTNYKNSDEMLTKQQFINDNDNCNDPSYFNESKLLQNHDDLNDSIGKLTELKVDKKVGLIPLTSKHKNLSMLYCSLDEPETSSKFSSKNGSLSVGDLTSYEFYDQSDVSRDSDVADGETSDASDEVPQHLTKAKKSFKRSFIGQSICVDILNEDEGYVSNKSRRNGLNLDSNSDEDDFLTDLIEFKKKYGKSKPSGMRIAKSVENLLRLDKTNGNRIRSLSDAKDPKITPDHKTSKFFKKGIFLKNDKPHLKDSTEYFSDGNNFKNRRLSITLIKDSAKKLSGINEIYLDEHGSVIKKVEIKKLSGQSLGFYIRLGNGIDKIREGIFVSRVTLGSFVDVNNLLYTGDQILRVNQREIGNLSLEEVVSMMQESNDLLLETRSALPLPMHSKPKLHKKDSTTQLSMESSYSITDNNLLNEASPKSSNLVRTFSAPLDKSNTKPNNDFELPKADKYFEDAASKKNVKNDEKLKHKVAPSRSNHPTKQLNLTKSTWFCKAVDIDTSSSCNLSEDIRIYKSDKDDTVQRKTFTGSLHISIHKITGCREQGSFYCGIEIDGEAKANTASKIMQENVEIEETFEIEVNQANLVEVKLFLNNKEKPSDYGRIYIGKLLAYENKSLILLNTAKYGIKIKLSIQFIGIDSFLKRAPSKRVKGVFGFSIMQTLIDDGNTIPLIVRKCVEEIELRGLTQEGIYRISGNARKKKILRTKFEENNFSEENEDGDEFDCHVMSGVLKDYLRELPQPLISQELYLKIYEKSLEENRSQSYDTVLLNVMKRVHYSNRATLVYIMEHLLRVASKKDENKMDFKNLAVCFGPVMMCPPATASGMQNFKKQVDALEYLLEIWPKSTSQNQV